MNSARGANAFYTYRDVIGIFGHHATITLYPRPSWLGSDWGQSQLHDPGPRGRDFPTGRSGAMVICVSYAMIWKFQELQIVQDTEFCKFHLVVQAILKCELWSELYVESQYAKISKT